MFLRSTQERKKRTKKGVSKRVHKLDKNRQITEKKGALRNDQLRVQIT